MGRERHVESGLDRSGDRLFRTQLPSRGWSIFRAGQLTAIRNHLVSLHQRLVRLPRNLVTVRRDDVWLHGNNVGLRGNDVRLGEKDIRLGGNDVGLRGNAVRLRGNDIRLPIGLVFNNLRNIGRKKAQKAQNHRGIPLLGPDVCLHPPGEQIGAFLLLCFLRLFAAIPTAEFRLNQPSTIN